MNMTPFISVIITNKNAYKWFNKCLTSLYNQTFKDFEVILVDDGSTDGSMKYVEKKFPWVHTVYSLENAGFAKANNLGASAAKGRYLLILNADTHMEKDTLQKAYEILRKNPSYRLAQLDIRNYKKSDLMGPDCIFGMDRFGYPIAPSKMFYTDAAAMIITKDLFFKLRGFDETFFIYLEDMDLCWRAHLLGENVYFLRGVYVYHFAGGTSVSTQLKEHGIYATSLRRRYDAQKNSLRSLIKNYSLSTLFWTLPISLLLASAEGFLYLFKGNILGFFALHRSIFWNIFNISNTLDERRKVQETRKVSDKVILSKCYKGVSKINSLFKYGVPTMKT